MRFALPLSVSKRTLMLSLSGVIAGTTGIAFSEPFVSPVESEGPAITAPVLQPAPVIPVEYVSVWHEFSAYEPGMLDEPEAKKPVVRTQPKPAPTAHVKIPKNAKSPNSIVIPLSQAPSIAIEVRRLPDGRKVCAHKDDDPHDSYQDKEVHIDRQCCLDPDEVPNPRCYYPELEKKKKR